MKHKILSVIVAIAMVFSTAVVSFADTSADATTVRVKASISSGNTSFEGVVYDDFTSEVKVNTTDGTVDAGYVSGTLTMSNIGSLGIEGDKTASYTLETGIEKTAVLSDWIDLSTFEGATINGSVNGLAFGYIISKGDSELSWKGEPTNEAAISAAWKELAAHVAVASGESDSKIQIMDGTIMQIGNNIITIDTADGAPLVLDDFNAQGDDMTQQILDAVTFTSVSGQDEVCSMYLPAGSALFVGASSATLATNANINIDGLDLGDLDLVNLQTAANDKNLEQMIVETLKLAEGTLEAVNEAGEINVHITTGCETSCPAGDKCQDGCSCYDPANNVYRVYGATRYETSIKAADALKDELGVEKFKTIIVASGKTFADALPGSYLAAKKEAPMLLIDGKKASAVRTYISQNLDPDGTVYVLGGIKAVPESWMGSIEYTRLGGADRYETNVQILEEAKVPADAKLMVCTGKEFADSLSASATGNPIMLVGKSLTGKQRSFLSSLTNEKYYIVGGTKAVSSSVEKSLKPYITSGDKAVRLSGATRYETSVLVAKTFFDKPEYAVLAYAENFADGLSGGPVAYAMDAPLLLTKTGKQATAAAYTKAKGIKYGKVMGGSIRISDGAVKAIFGNDTKIINY